MANLFQQQDEEWRFTLDGIQPAVDRPAPAAPTPSPMQQYEQLGAAYRQLSVAQAQPQQISPLTGPVSDQLGVPPSNLTAGFDRNWLSKQISAGSADGAKIGGGGGGGKKQQEDDMDDPHNPNRDAVTQREYGKMKGAGRLQGGWRDFFGVGAGNKMGMGR